ncbi:MAG: tetratricopeptide repeat protein [Acidobacteriota bacterium]
MASAVSEQHGSERLGRYLRQLRRGYGYTLRRVEEQSGQYGPAIDNSQLSRFEKGKAAPSFDKLRILARVFNVPVQHFSDILDLAECDAVEPREQDPEALFQIGLAAYREGDYVRSYAVFETLTRRAARETGPVWAENGARGGYHMAVALKKMGRLSMAESELRNLLRRPDDSYPPSLRVRALLQLSFVYRELGDLYLASVIAKECHMRAVTGADDETVAAALNTAGIIEEERGHLQRAAESYRSALDVIRRDPDRELMRVTVQANLGGVLTATGRYRAGVALLKQALTVARRHGFRRPVCLALTKLAAAHRRKGHLRQAEELLRESTEIAAAKDDTYQDILFINAFLSWQMAREAGRTAKARILFGRLKYLRNTLESRFPEVDSFDRAVRGETHHG